MCDCCLKQHVSNLCDSYITARTTRATFVTAISRREQVTVDEMMMLLMKPEQKFRLTTVYIYIYVWKLSQTVLELDFRAVKFCSSLGGIWTHTIVTLQHHSLSLTSSALDHSTTSTIYTHTCIYIYIMRE